MYALTSIKSASGQPVIGPLSTGYGFGASSKPELNIDDFSFSKLEKATPANPAAQVRNLTVGTFAPFRAQEPQWKPTSYQQTLGMSYGTDVSKFMNADGKQITPALGDSHGWLNKILGSPFLGVALGMLGAPYKVGAPSDRYLALQSSGSGGYNQPQYGQHLYNQYMAYS